MRVVTTIEGLEQLLNQLSPELLEVRARAAMRESLDVLHEAVVQGTPIDTGSTANRLTKEMTGTVVDFTGTIASPDEYFYNIEYGRRPGARMPPHEPLEAWASRHGIEGRGSVFLLRRAIARRGIPPLMVMHKAVERNETKIQEIWERAFSDLERDLD